MTIEAQNFTAMTPTAAVVVGIHNFFTYNGLTLNDRTLLETYRVDDLTGFEDPDLRISDEDNTQDDGGSPGPGFYGSRTMTLSGAIVAGTYPKLLEMQRTLQDAFMDLVERPLIITSSESGRMLQVPIEIYCRKADKILLTKKIEQSSVYEGTLESPFTIILKATDPVYKSTIVQEQILVPNAVSFLGRAYDRSYDLSYNHQMDQYGNPTTANNSMTVVNSGNWYALPVIIFEGLQASARLLNISSGQEIILAHTIPSGDQVILDVATGEVTDSMGINKSNYLDTVSDWIRLLGTRDLPSGQNELQLFVSDFDGSASVTVQWRDSYL